MTAFDGQSITYDANGNPTKYYNGGTMTWRNGRQLASYSLGGKTYRYEYDVNGLRTRKSNADGGYTEYYIIDGLAVAERRYYSGGGVQYTLRYLYDESNNPVGFGMQYPNSTRWTNYYFEKNVQGDVIGVYQKEGDGNSATHILAARYSYDPYGNPTSMTNGAGTAVSQTSNTIAAINPFRYRGYRYDGDTGLYYLQSRYYDPVSCRFVNADKYASTGQGITGCNMFVYCNGNPVNFIDNDGEEAVAIVGGIIVVIAIVIIYTPPVQTTIHNISNSITELAIDLFSEAKDTAISIQEASKKGTGKKQTKKSGKEKSSNKPSWMNEDMVNKDLSAQQNAKNLLNEKYGPGNWKKGPGTEFNQIVKWLIRSGILASTVTTPSPQKNRELVIN